MINKDLLKKYQPTLSDTALDNFDKYAAHLVERNKQMNLTGITEPDEIVIKHFVDSLKFFEYVDVPQGASIIDVGTGAGFPGLPLLLARNDIALTLMDSLNKRLTFLEAVLAELGLSARAKLVHARAEDGARSDTLRGGFDAAFTRAVAPASVALEWTVPFLKVGGVSLLYKGAKAEEELSAAANALRLLSASATLARYDAPWGERNVILARKDAKTPKEYPRKAGTAAKKPL